MADRKRSFKIPPMTDATGGAAYPLGTYLIEVTGVDIEAENRFSDSERVRFDMAVIRAYQTSDRARLRELMTEGAPLCTWANLVFTPRSRLREIVEALMRHTYEVGETPGDLDVLVGHNAIVSVVAHTKTTGPNTGEVTTKVGAFQPLADDEVDERADAAAREAPGSGAARHSGRSSAGDRVVASAEAMSGRPEPRPAPRRAPAPQPEPEPEDELDAFDAPNRAPRAREGAPPADADPPGASDPDLTRRQAAARQRAPY